MSSPEFSYEEDVIRFASSQFNSRAADKAYAALGTPLHLLVMRFQHGEVFESSGFSHESVEAEYELARINYGKVAVRATAVIAGIFVAHYLVGPSLITPRP